MDGHTLRVDHPDMGGTFVVCDCGKYRKGIYGFSQSESESNIRLAYLEHNQHVQDAEIKDLKKAHDRLLREHIALRNTIDSRLPRS
jgi:hypothetical protein